MSGNMGYRFYRCTYRKQSGSSRLTECATANEPAKVTEEKPSLAELGDLVKPYRPEHIPEPEQPQERPTVLEEDDMAALLAKLNAQYSTSSKYSRNDRKQGKKGNVQQKASNTPDVKKQRREAETAAKAVNNIVSFDLKVLYPGLYAGLGYAHGLPNQKDDIKVGFSFDYTTGLPYIPGSSLKGALRSRFINQPEDAADALGIPAKSLRRVENALFGKRVEDKDDHSGCLVCYDVFPVLTEQGAALMATDNITPHHANPFAPPVPINTLRLKPGTTLRFCFSMPEVILEAADGCREITRADMRKAFVQLLVDWGIGAKTNVGYGSLEVPR